MGVAEDFAPSFVKKPQLRQEDDGNRLIFECQLLSSPKPEIEWYRSETLLIEDARTRFKIQAIGDNKFTVILDLDDVVETDAGLYKVKAKNKLGEVSASINLNFSPADEPKERQIDGFAPTFTKKPAIRQEDDGKRLLFECRVNADPKPIISWFHNNTAVKESPRHKLTVDKDGQSYFASLEIKNVTVEDAGKYKVNAKNELGESNATISLNFDSDEAPVPDDGIKPTFTERPVIRQSEDGGNITFECRCVGEPKPTVTWYHRKEEIKEGGRYKISLEEDQKLYHMAKLEITSVVSGDQGEYQTKARNKHGEGVATINLNFEGGSKKIPDGKSPRFPKKPTIRQEDDILIMECILEAHPLPDITWYRGDKQINDSSRTKMSRKATVKDTYILTLEIKNPTRDDGGNYRCNAFNMYGESNANIALNFQGTGDANGFAPSFTEKPRIIPNDSGTLITMKCKCKAKPEPKVTWYRGQDVVKETKKIKIKSTLVSEDLYELTLEIKDPGAADGGTYRCNVQNEFGESNANLNLNIEAEPEPEGEPPTFIEKPRIISENNGKLVIMECKVKSDPKPDIIWFRNGITIKETNRIKMSIETRGGEYYIKLELIDPQLEDSGLYKCNIKNNLGELNANLTLNIEIVPVIKDKPKIIKIIKKRTVVIECTVASKFEPTCTWFKETNEVHQSERHVYQCEQTKEGEFSVKLEINEVQETDKGAYKLIARNEKGEAVSQIVNLVDIPEEERKVVKPEITRKLVDQKVTEGKTFELLVAIKTTDRSCKVSWFKDTMVVKETKEITTTFDGTTARLTFSSAKTEHTATFKCVISNEIGKDESSCKIVVEKMDAKKKKQEEEEKKKQAKEAEEKRKAEEEEEAEKKKVKQEKAKQEKEEEEEKKKIEEKTKIEDEKKKIAEKTKIEDEKKKAEQKNKAAVEEKQKKEEELKKAENDKIKKVEDEKKKKSDEESKIKTIEEEKTKKTAEKTKQKEQDNKEEEKKNIEIKKKKIDEKKLPDEKQIDAGAPEKKGQKDQIGLKKVERMDSQEIVPKDTTQTKPKTDTKQTPQKVDPENDMSEEEVTSIKEEKEVRRRSIVQQKEVIVEDGKVSRRSSVQVEQESKTESRRSSVIEKKALEKVEEVQPLEELPKLRKTSTPKEVKEEEKKVEPKAKAKAKPKSKKYEELPEIPDYERPVLEKYQKSEFEKSDFSRDLGVPSKMEKPQNAEIKKEPEQVAIKNGLPKKEEATPQPAEQPKRLSIGKGKLPGDAPEEEKASLKPVIIVPEKSQAESEVPFKQQRRPSYIKNAQPVKNENFLSVILKPVTKDAKMAKPQQAKHILKESASMKEFDKKANFAKVSQMPKFESIPVIKDDYEKPQLEVFEKPAFDKTEKPKPVESKPTVPVIQENAEPAKTEKPRVPQIKAPPGPGEPPKIEVIREKRPSLVPGPPSRRGSLIPPPEEMGRRPSLIINDEF